MAKKWDPVNGTLEGDTRDRSQPSGSAPVPSLGTLPEPDTDSDDGAVPTVSTVPPPDLRS